MFRPVVIDPLRWPTSHCFLEIGAECIGIWVLRHVTVVDGTERITLPMWRKCLCIASQVVGGPSCSLEAEPCLVLEDHAAHLPWVLHYDLLAPPLSFFHHLDEQNTLA